MFDGTAIPPGYSGLYAADTSEWGALGSYENQGILGTDAEYTNTSASLVSFPSNLFLVAPLQPLLFKYSTILHQIHSYLFQVSPCLTIENKY